MRRVEADTKNALSQLAGWLAAILDLMLCKQCHYCIPNSQVALAWALKCFIKIPDGCSMYMVASDV
eukprot:844135-Karenia_brevis.AAC.1